MIILALFVLFLVCNHVKAGILVFNTIRFFRRCYRKIEFSSPVEKNSFVLDLAPVVQKVDNAIHWINLYPVDSAVICPTTYPLDSDLSVDSAIQRFNIILTTRARPIWQPSLPALKDWQDKSNVTWFLMGEGGVGASNWQNLQIEEIAVNVVPRAQFWSFGHQKTLDTRLNRGRVCSL